MGFDLGALLGLKPKTPAPQLPIDPTVFRPTGYGDNADLMDDGVTYDTPRYPVPKGLYADPNAIPDQKGMFGVKGTLRDVLGTIGDAFLVQSGNKAIFQPQRQAERDGAELAGLYDADPEKQLEMLNHLAARNPAMAQEVYKDLGTLQLNKEKAQESKLSAESLRKDRNFDNNRQMERVVGGMISNLASKDPEVARALWPTAYGQIKRMADSAGYDLAALGISETFDPQAIQSLSGLGNNAYQQQILPIREEDLRLRREGFDRADARATQAEQGRMDRYTPPQPTEVGIMAPIIEKVKQGGMSSLTPGEKEAYDRAFPPPRPVKKSAAQVAAELAAGGGGKPKPAAKPAAKTQGYGTIARGVPFDPAQFKGQSKRGPDGTYYWSNGKYWTKQDPKQYGK